MAGGGAAGVGAAGGSSGPLDLTVAAKLTAVDDEGFESLSLDVTLGAPASPDVTLKHGRVFFAHEGGYAMLLGDVVKQKGSFYGVGPALTPGKVSKLPLSYVWSTPVTHVVVVLQGALGDGAFEQGAAAEAARVGFDAPPPMGPVGPASIAVRGPLVRVKTLGGDVVVPLVAQVVPWTSSPVVRKSFTATMEGGTAVPFGAAAAVVGVPTSVLVPTAGGATSVHLEAEVTIDGAASTLTRDVPITELAPVAVASPLKGTWRWRNGPCETVLHTHHQYPEQSFAYDILVEKNGASYAGDPNLNASYFAFGQPFFAALPGKVVLVDDTHDDNDGASPTPKNPDGDNNEIVVERDDGVRCVYTHLSKGSAKVKVGDAVSAGDELGKVGNAGQSSEPHLHFACFRTNATGRIQGLPLSLMVGGATGTPVGGDVLTF